MKRFLPQGVILFSILWVVLLVGGRSRFFQDPGTFWHTVVGERILNTGFFDRDSYTFTKFDQPWLPHQWLGETAMALAHRVDGFDSLLLMTCTLLAGIYAWVGARLIRAGIHWSLASVFVAAAVMASSGHFHARPHLATIACFAVTFAMVTDYEANRFTTARLVWLIPLFIVWTNSHGGMLGGLATLALAILGWLMAARLGVGGERGYLRFAFLSGIWLLCLGTAFLNPWGSRLPEVWLEIYESKLLPQIVVEHSRLDPASLTGLTVLGFGLVYLVLLVSTFPQQPRVVWLLPLIWFGLACLRVRHAPLFAVSALIAVADLFPFTTFAERCELSNNDLFTRQPDPPEPIPVRDRLASIAVPVGLILLSISLQFFRIPVPVIGHNWARLDPKVWPLELLDDLRANQNEAKPPKMFDEYTYGGFLIYFAPGYRVFVDDRCELFGDNWLSDFVHASMDPNYASLAETLRDWQTEFGRFDFALTYSGSNFDGYFRRSPYWEPVSGCEVANFYRRKK